MHNNTNNLRLKPSFFDKNNYNNNNTYKLTTHNFDPTKTNQKVKFKLIIWYLSHIFSRFFPNTVYTDTVNTYKHM